MTISGWSRLFSAFSTADFSAGGANEASIGAEKTRAAPFPHRGHVIASGGVPRGRVTSNTPSGSQRYSYVGIRTLLAQFGDIGTAVAWLTWWTVPLVGAGSKSKILRGM